jgi:hypothetical protein
MSCCLPQCLSRVLTLTPMTVPTPRCLSWKALISPKGCHNLISSSPTSFAMTSTHECTRDIGMKDEDLAGVSLEDGVPEVIETSSGSETHEFPQVLSPPHQLPISFYER